MENTKNDDLEEEKSSIEKKSDREDDLSAIVLAKEEIYKEYEMSYATYTKLYDRIGISLGFAGAVVAGLIGVMLDKKSNLSSSIFFDGGIIMILMSIVVFFYLMQGYTINSVDTSYLRYKKELHKSQSKMLYKLIEIYSDSNADLNEAQEEKQRLFNKGIKIFGVGFVLCIFIIWLRGKGYEICLRRI